MRFPTITCSLLPGVLAGAMILTGTACSRSDKAESGSDTTAATLPDTGVYAPQPSAGDTAPGAISDTSKAPEQSSTTASPSDSNAAGYRPMGRDTSDVPSEPSDSARVTADTAEATPAPADSSVSAIPPTTEMARDTSTIADQTDTAVSSDTTEMVRVRPPEDSTELLGNATDTDDAADETADEHVFTPEVRQTVAASEASTDEVGAAAVAGNVTGEDAVALLSRQGLRCAVVDPEVNEAVRWDMSSTPVTLNPCGMGTMNLSRIWTEGQRGRGAAGQ